MFLIYTFYIMCNSLGGKNNMHAPLMTKYIYQIRSRNGAVVDNLQIYGRTEEEAKRKLEQMYRNCVILETRVARPQMTATSSYEDVLNLIAGHR